MPHVLIKYAHVLICICTARVPATLVLFHYSVTLLLFLDIDECEETTDGCEQTCNNIEGSFECLCEDGYLLDVDGKQCTGTKTICTLIQY